MLIIVKDDFHETRIKQQSKCNSTLEVALAENIAGPIKGPSYN